MISILFCTENYQAVKYKDNDKLEFAISYIFEKSIVKDGYFFYLEFNISIKMISNFIWY